MADTLTFAIDGVAMPKPSAWQTNPKPISADAERLPGSGKAVVPYKTMCWETTWTYKYLSQTDFNTLYDAYILATIRNKSMYHTLTTIDSNTGNVVTMDVYTQSDFSAPLYRIKTEIVNNVTTQVRYYKDVKFVFISLGGDEYEDEPEEGQGDTE